MKVKNWDWTKADNMIATTTINRARKAAKIIKNEVYNNCPVGTVSRPMYRKGIYANQEWTKRDAGALKKSVRIVELDEQKRGFRLAQFRTSGNYGNVRVYVGNRLAYYAQIVEYYMPFMRPAVERTLSKVKEILENG